MKILSMVVEGFGVFDRKTMVGPFGPGLNVVFGANGCGKSTLVTALARGFFDRHKTQGQAIVRAKPWLRSLTPRVTVEVEQKGVSYRFRKQFLDSPYSELERNEHGVWRRLAEGDDADAQIRNWMQAEAPVTGATSPEKWGYAQFLWATQGGMKIDELSGSLRQAIEQSLDAQTRHAPDQEIAKRIEALYDQAFTEKTGKERLGKDTRLGEIERERNQIIQFRSEALDRMASVDALRLKLDSLSSERQNSAAMICALEERIRDAQSEAENFARMQTELESASAAARASEKSHEQLKNELAEYETLKQKIEQSERRLALDKEEWLKLEERLESLSKIEVEAKQKWESLRSEPQAIADLRAHAKHAKEFLDDSAAVKVAEQKLADVDACVAAIESNRREHENLNAPTPLEMTAIRRAALEVDRAKTRVQASQYTISLAPIRPLELVEVGAASARHSIEPGKSFERSLIGEFAFEIEGVGTIRVKAPEGLGAGAEEKLLEAEKKFRSCCEPFQSDSLDELEARFQASDKIRQEFSQYEAQRKTLMAATTREALSRDLDEKRLRIRKRIATRPDWETVLPDPEQLERSAAEKSDQWRRDSELAETDYEKAKDENARKQKARHELRAKIDTDSRLREEWQLRLEHLEREGKSLEQRRAELNQLAMAWTSDTQRRDVAQKALASFAIHPGEKLKQDQRSLEEAKRKSAQLADQISEARGRLNSLLEDAPYDRVVSADEAFERIDQEWRAEKERLEAIKLLYNTLQAVEAERREHLLQPIAQTTLNYVRKLGLNKFSGLDVSESFLPERVRASSDHHVELDCLSSGEKEQIYFAARLGLVDNVFKDQAYPIVLDDVFVHSDGDRLKAVIDILQDVGTRRQVLLLTCHPERFHHIPGATFFDLEAIKRSATVLEETSSVSEITRSSRKTSTASARKSVDSPNPTPPPPRRKIVQSRGQGTFPEFL